MSRIEPHDEFLELCAVSTSGQLSEEDQRRLQEHLVVCSSCREALQQYEAIIRHAIPAMAAEEAPENLEAGGALVGEAGRVCSFRAHSTGRGEARNRAERADSATP